MKYYLSIALASLMMIGTVNAQSVNFGIKGGLNVYNIKDDNESEYDSKTGIHLGILGHIHLSKQWGMQPELVYSAQGAQFTSTGVESKLKLGYINVPILFQYMFDNGFRIEAGPQVGFLVSAKTEANDVEVDVKDDLKGADFSIGFGLGYIHVPSGFGLDARYNLGVSNISEDDDNNVSNRGFQIGLFYQFKHRD